MIRLNHPAFFKALGACLVVSIVACERTMVPRRNRLAELRSQATNGFGGFRGTVRVQEGTEPCHRATKRVPGVTVEMGLWDGSPEFYRDTITREQPNTLNEPRFQLLASTTSDANGQFLFVEVPRGPAYAFRAVPPRDGPWRVAYGYSLYGPATGVNFGNYPDLCVQPR